jgi:hypothetical protein
MKFQYNKFADTTTTQGFLVALPNTQTNLRLYPDPATNYQNLDYKAN